ncbi:Uncharacterised protein [Salmonella enterica subsp. enterica serovar Typhimurium str. DT104]|nr:Uncharacterised protein [Salmonella enterica subsp. enterica serovar Typhimurium str. DT104]
MFNQDMNISVAGCGFQAVEDVAEILAEIILNKRAGFQFQCTEIADGTQLCRQMQLHKIPGNVRLCQKLPECRVVGSRRSVFLFHQSML